MSGDWVVEPHPTGQPSDHGVFCGRSPEFFGPSSDSDTLGTPRSTPMPFATAHTASGSMPSEADEWQQVHAAAANATQEIAQSQPPMLSREFLFPVQQADVCGTCLMLPVHLAP